MRSTLLLLVTVAAVFTSPLHLFAQAAPAVLKSEEVEVSAVKFSSARFGGDTWIEADVEVEARPGGKIISGQFVDRVRVILSLGSEGTDDKGAKTFVFFRSSAEILTLEAGKANVRFYFAPEAVKRDKLSPAFKFYVAEVEVGGQAQRQAKPSFSAAFTNAASIQTFLTKATSESAPNEGLLMPQFLSPFAADPQKRAPTFSRK